MALQAAAPADGMGEARLPECAALARTSPEQAVAAANAWLIQSGGIDARQCLGLAYAGQARWQEAAAIFEEAAREADGRSDPRRADLWAQAGNAWLAAGEATRAVQALDAALATEFMTGELRGEIHLDRARALVALGNAAGARPDIDRGLELVPADPFAWYLSAALARREQDLARARSDIARAKERAPQDPDILLLAGTIAGLSGNMEEAERLYRQVIEIAPESAAARSARESFGEAGETPENE